MRARPRARVCMWAALQLAACCFPNTIYKRHGTLFSTTRLSSTLKGVDHMSTFFKSGAFTINCFFINLFEGFVVCLFFVGFFVVV